MLFQSAKHSVLQTKLSIIIKSKFFQMSSNSTSEHQAPIHLFFTPIKPPQTFLKVRQDNFVLDCTNPGLSKMPTYTPQQDHYNQSYLSILFARKQKQNKENSPSRSPKLYPYPRKGCQRAVSREEFRNFLSTKINNVTQTNFHSSQCQPQSYLERQWTSSHTRKRDIDQKQEAFLDKKFRCFRVRGKARNTNQ